MGVITWRNVEAPDLRGAASMLQLASNGFNSGFDKLNQVLQNEQATAEANWKVQRDNNTQAFLNSINQYRTADEYQAAVGSGALDTSKYGAQIDRAAVRAALDGRLATLQGRDLVAGDFADKMQARKDKPFADVFATNIANGDIKHIPGAVSAYVDSGNMSAATAASILEKARTRGLETEATDREKIKFDREGKKLDSELLTDKARRGLMGAQAAHLQTEQSSEKVALKAAQAASSAQNKAAELLIKNSPMDAGHMGTHAGQKTFYDELGKMGLDPTQVRDIGNVISTKYANGVVVGVDGDGKEVRVGVPVSTLLAAVRGANEKERFRNFFGSTGQGDRVAKKLEDLMAEPTHVEALQQALQAQGIQYRALTKAGPDTTVSGSIAHRTSIPKPTGFGVEDGVDLISQTVKARADRIAQVQDMMTAAEIAESQKTGKLPFRFKRLLEAGNER